MKELKNNKYENNFKKILIYLKMKFVLSSEQL